MISLNSVIKFLTENNKHKKINDIDSISKFELKKDAMKILESIESNYKENPINNYETINNNSSFTTNRNIIIKSLPESFEIIFNNNIDKFYIENKISRNYKNKTSIFIVFI